MTRRLALAWSTGASLGYVVGWLAGSNVLRMAEGHRLAREHRAAAAYLAAEGADPTPEQRARARAVPPLRRPEPRTPSRTGVESREAGNGAQTTAQRMPLWRDALPTFAPCPVSSPTHHLPCIRVGAHDEHWWRDPRTEEKR